MWKWRENKQMNQGIYWRQRRRLFQRKPDELTHTHTYAAYNYMCRNVYIFLFTSISVNLIYRFRMNARPPLYSTIFMNFHDFCYFNIGKFVTLYEPLDCDLRRTFIYLWERIPCPFFLALKVFTNRFAYLKSSKSRLHLELTYCWLIWEK